MSDTLLIKASKSGRRTVISLLARIEQGDRTAEDEIIRHLMTRFVVLARRRVSGAEAEDVAHTACLTVLEKLRSGVIPDNFMPWAYDILRNVIGNHYQARDMRRQSTSRTVRIEDLPDIAQPDALPDLRLRLLKCVRALIKGFPRHARVLNLVFQGFRTDEICEKLAIKPGYLYVLLNRGRRLLRDCLESGRTP